MNFKELIKLIEKCPSEEALHTLLNITDNEHKLFVEPKTIEDLKKIDIHEIFNRLLAYPNTAHLMNSVIENIYKSPAFCSEKDNFV